MKTTLLVLMAMMTLTLVAIPASAEPIEVDSVAEESCNIVTVTTPRIVASHGGVTVVVHPQTICL